MSLPKKRKKQSYICCEESGSSCWVGRLAVERVILRRDSKPNSRVEGHGKSRATVQNQYTALSYRRSCLSLLNGDRGSYQNQQTSQSVEFKSKILAQTTRGGAKENE